MRNFFAKHLTSLSKKDERVILLSGDIGNKLFDDFKNANPNRFFNCGVAEANMMGVASGMASCGLRPFIYTIAPFTTTRCLEQIKLDVGYHNVPVTIIGTGAGLSYAKLGPTHHSLEDIAILRTIPNMQIFAPADNNELRFVLDNVLKDKKPTYIRIGKKGEPDVHGAALDCEFGKFSILKHGANVLIISAGTVLSESVTLANRLVDKGVSVELVSAYSLKPFDNEYLHHNLKKFDLAVTIEEHSIIGGLGSILAEWKSHNGNQTPHIISGIADEFIHEIGSQEYIRRNHGLNFDILFDSICKKLVKCT